MTRTIFQFSKDLHGILMIISTICFNTFLLKFMHLEIFVNAEKLRNLRRREELQTFVTCLICTNRLGKRLRRGMLNLVVSRWESPKELQHYGNRRNLLLHTSEAWSAILRFCSEWNLLGNSLASDFVLWSCKHT